MISAGLMVAIMAVRELPPRGERRREERGKEGEREGRREGRESGPKSNYKYCIVYICYGHYLPSLPPSLPSLSSSLVSSPKFSLRIHVSTESRYGTYFSLSTFSLLFPFLFTLAVLADCSASLCITWPSVVRDLLMFAPSYQE